MSQVFRMSLAARALDTMGARATSAFPTRPGSSKGRPAPEMMASAPASTAAWTRGAYCFMATIRFTATRPRPPDRRRARAISCFKPRRSASWGFWRKSGSRYPAWAALTHPIPPQAATAPARPPKDTPTPMPPWITGRGRRLFLI